MFQSENNKNNKMSSILGPEIEIKGDVKAKGSLLIYGKVLGNISSSGTVSTANGSYIKGNIESNEANLSGHIEGDVEVKKKLILGNKSHLSGNLRASILTIEEGAKFDGMCNMAKVDSIGSTSKAEKK
jgi:cytoskeletal protein CcmA (bactofilin family)